jgi:hypothetical protein
VLSEHEIRMKYVLLMFSEEHVKRPSGVVLCTVGGRLQDYVRYGIISTGVRSLN